jgi:hypothetical protein
MKIGKAKYLPLLTISNDFDDRRTLIVQPLADIYARTRQNAKERIEQYSETIKQTVAKIVDDDTGTTSHDLLDSSIEDIAFEHDVQICAISTSLIIVAQSYLHSKFQSVVSAYEFFKTPYKAGQLRDHFFSFGEKINGVPWAEAVKAASNYARHFEEWRVKIPKYEKDSGQLILTKISNLIGQLNPRSQDTPKTLVALGFTEEQVFDKRNNLTPKIVEALKLSDPAEFSKCASVWTEEVMDELHRKFDHLDK